MNILAQMSLLQDTTLQ